MVPIQAARVRVQSAAPLLRYDLDSLKISVDTFAPVGEKQCCDLCTDQSLELKVDFLIERTDPVFSCPVPLVINCAHLQNTGAAFGTEPTGPQGD